MDKIVKFSALAIFVGFWANTASGPSGGDNRAVVAKSSGC